MRLAQQRGGDDVMHHLSDMPPKRDQAACMLEPAKTTPAVLATFLAEMERFQIRSAPRSASACSSTH
jgi:hypothetical protein